MPGTVNVHHSEDLVQLAGEPPGVRAVVQLLHGGVGGICDQCGFDQADPFEIDGIDQQCRFFERRRLEVRLVPPVAEEDVPVHQPQVRLQSGEFERGGQDDDGVQAGAEAPSQDLLRGADPLRLLPPGRGRLAVPDTAVLHRRHQGFRNGIDPLRSGLVALQGSAAGGGLQQIRGLGAERGDGRMVGLDERREGFEGQQAWTVDPVVCSEQFDVVGLLGDEFAVGLEPGVHGAVLAVLQLQHGGGVGQQIRLGDGHGFARGQVQIVFQGAGDRPGISCDAELQHRAADLGTAVGDGESADDATSVVGHDVAEVGGGFEGHADVGVGQWLGLFIRFGRRVLHRRHQGFRNGIDPLRSGLVALQGSAAGGGLQQIRGLGAERGDGRMVGLDERREGFEGQQAWTVDPVVCSEQFDVVGLLGDEFAVGLEPGVHGAVLAVLQLQHGGGVGQQIRLGDGHGFARGQVQIVFQGAGDRPGISCDAELQHRAADLGTAVGDGESADDATSVVGHDVAEVGGGFEGHADVGVGQWLGLFIRFGRRQFRGGGFFGLLHIRSRGVADRLGNSVFLQHRPDLLGARVDPDRVEQPSRGVEVALDVVVGERLVVGPEVADLAHLAGVGAGLRCQVEGKAEGAEAFREHTQLNLRIGRSVQLRFAVLKVILVLQDAGPLDAGSGLGHGRADERLEPAGQNIQCASYDLPIGKLHHFPLQPQL